AIQTVLKHANLLSDNSTPELDKAKIRKANADASVAEARAKAMENSGQDVELLVEKMLDNLAKEDSKHGS
ncbi:MAG: helix-turn-helix domain-containing protein, partial [Lactobacillus sp.]|nr:helix-turn-helix domain-containing protein [Lactobacillus sp.]